MTTTDLYNLLKDETAILKKYGILRLYINSYRALASHPGAPKALTALGEVLSAIIKNPPPELLKLLQGNTDITVDVDSVEVPAEIVEFISQPINFGNSKDESNTPPDIMAQLKSLAAAAKKYTESGFKNCTKEQYEERLAICNRCEFFDRNAFFGSGRCLKCGCSGVKLKLGISSCPINKWGPVV